MRQREHSVMSVAGMEKKLWNGWFWPFIAAFLLVAVTIFSTAQSSWAIDEAPTDEISADEISVEGIFAEGDLDVETPEPQVISESVDESGAADVVVQLGAVRDTFIASNAPNANFGGADTLAVGYNRDGANLGALRTLVQFDFPATIPTGATINSAQIRLYQYSITGISPMRIVARRLTGPWEEFTVTWGSQPGFGGERASTFVDAGLGWKEWDITDLARQWQTGDVPNYGVLIEGLEEVAENQRLFYSRNGPADLRPVLIVDYTMAAPPTSRLLNPVNPYQPNTTFIVRWEADDPAGAGIAHFDVQYREPGQDWRAWQTQTTAREAQFTGEHGRTYEFRVRAVGQTGAVEPFPDAAQARTTVDTVPPSLTVNPIPPFINQPDFTVTWSATDPVSGVRNYDVQHRYGGGDWVDARLGTTQTSYTLAAREGTTTQVRVRARDNAGNVSAYETVGTVLDTTPPLACIVIFRPSLVPENTPFTVTWVGTDMTGAGVQSYDVQVRYNWGPWQNWQQGVAATSAQYTPDQGPGVYEFRVRARDTLGNAGEFRPTPDAQILVGVELPEAEYYLPIISLAPFPDGLLTECRRQS